MSHRPDFPLEMRCWALLISYYRHRHQEPWPHVTMFYPLSVVTSHFVQARPWAFIEAPQFIIPRTFPILILLTCRFVECATRLIATLGLIVSHE